jgi:two-component system, OmpR family, phosphate regulon sensor histidine kinase PhoR
VTVSAEAERDYVHLSVKDTGFGMTEEDLGRIFERFYRVKNDKTRFIPGTGLGLAIVKSIVEAHHGNVRVESEIDRGSTFHVLLPVMLP